MTPRHTPLKPLRPALCLVSATLALLAAPSWAATAGGLPAPAAGETAAAPAVLPYGAGYEQRLRAARSTAQGSPSLPDGETQAAPTRSSGFGQGRSGGHGGGSGGGGGGGGKGGGR
jgi:uncharacterized membrane protein YgcG